MTGELYHLYYEEMVHWAVSMTKNLSSAEDLVQETFLRAMKNEQLFKGMEFYQCRSWLYRTARNLYVDWVRHATHEVITETMPEQGEISRDFQNLDCEQILSILLEEERILFVMRYLEGYTSTEIGKIFQMPPATVRSRLALARRHLRKVWEE